MENTKRKGKILTIILSAIAAVFAATVILLSIWYGKLDKAADEFTMPDFEISSQEE